MVVLKGIPRVLPPKLLYILAQVGGLHATLVSTSLMASTQITRAHVPLAPAVTNCPAETWPHCWRPIRSASP